MGRRATPIIVLEHAGLPPCRVRLDQVHRRQGQTSRKPKDLSDFIALPEATLIDLKRILQTQLFRRETKADIGGWLR